MGQFLQTHKWKLIGIALIVLFCAVYLCAALQPGFWHGDVFLYQQKDGSFQGSNDTHQYVMDIQSRDGYAQILFSVDDVTHRYEVMYDQTNVSILQDGESVFAGTYYKRNGSYGLKSPDDPFINITVSTSITVPTFPSRGWLFNKAIDPDTETLGKPSMLLLALFLGLILFLDLRFPDLFFRLEFMWHVEGGEPTTWYRGRQKAGRFLLILGIIISLINGFP